MNKEKQIEEKAIEEMARVLRPLTLCPNCLASLNKDKKRDGGCYKPTEYECSLNRDILRYCEALYNAGYRKQSEGEWVVEAYKGDEIVIIPYIEHQHDEPFCSLCGKYALLDGGEEYVTSKFCPNCGAKMEGGE